jgi:hypothetical protein
MIRHGDGTYVHVRRARRYAHVDVDLIRSATPELHAALVTMALDAAERIEQTTTRRRHTICFGSVAALRMSAAELREVCAAHDGPPSCVYTWPCLAEDADVVTADVLALLDRHPLPRDWEPRTTNHKEGHGS